MNLQSGSAKPKLLLPFGFRFTTNTNNYSDRIPDFFAGWHVPFTGCENTIATICNFDFTETSVFLILRFDFFENLELLVIDDR